MLKSLATSEKKRAAYRMPSGNFHKLKGSSPYSYLITFQVVSNLMKDI